MNPGYLSLVLISMTLILLASGWKEAVIRGISYKAILLFFMVWIGTLSFSIRVAGYQVHICYLLTVAAAAIVVLRTDGLIKKAHLLSMGSLAASIYFMLAEAARVVPLLMGNPGLHICLWIGMIVFAMNRGALQQVACLSFGMAVGELLVAHAHQTAGTAAVLGGAVFQDRWWLALWIARGMTIMWSAAYAGCKKAVSGWTGRRKDDGR